jgi:cytochrome c biogenesis protein CcmG/thiol:disulfide interchange protein DsbE
MSSPHHPERHPDDLAAPTGPLRARRGLPRGVAWAGVLAVIVIAVMAWVALDGSADNADRLNADIAQPPGGGVAVNGPVPDVELTSLQGTPLALADYRGTPLVVNFWASWCPPCISEMPAFDEVYQQRNGTVAFVGINVRESADMAIEMAERTGVTYDLALDPNGAAARAFNVVNMPTTVFVTADGTVAGVHSGALTSAQLDERITALTPGGAAASAQ